MKSDRRDHFHASKSLKSIECDTCGNERWECLCPTPDVDPVQAMVDSLHGARNLARDAMTIANVIEDKPFHRKATREVVRAWNAINVAMETLGRMRVDMPAQTKNAEDASRELLSAMADVAMRRLRRRD